MIIYNQVPDGRRQGRGWLKVRDVLKRLEADGWYQIRMRGSHRILAHETKPGIVVVPGKSGDDIPKGTLASIWKQAQLEDKRWKSMPSFTNKAKQTGEQWFPTCPVAWVLEIPLNKFSKILKKRLNFTLKFCKNAGKPFQNPQLKSVVGVAAGGFLPTTQKLLGFHWRRTRATWSATIDRAIARVVLLFFLTNLIFAQV